MAPKKGKKPAKPEPEPPPEPEVEEVPQPEAEPEPVVVDSVNDWEPAKVMVKPKEQLVLTAKELAQEITKILKADNPQAPDNIARYNHKEKTYKNDPTVEQTQVHFSMEGFLLNIDSDDARRQKAAEEDEKEALLKEMERRKAEGGDAEEDARGLRNQFNFSERASQTRNNPLRERGTLTEPPPSVEYTAQCTQWEMYDAYMEDQARQKQSKEKQKGSKHKNEDDKSKKDTHAKDDQGDIIHGENMMRSSKIMERMVNQNTYVDIAHDFKYWEDASDQYREGEGTLLPLWKFFNEKAKRKHVTSITWNPEFYDLFAVGYGSYDFMKQGSGLICLYSLKNPSFPEFTCPTDTGVMCLDWHPQHSSVICVGLYDGTVAVFDVRTKKGTPIFQSSVKTGKHTDPVWEVRWQEEDMAKNLNFFSISSDGRVTLWTLSKNDLEYSDVMELKLIGAAKSSDPEDETTMCGLAGGCCMDFNLFSDHLFVVGTEEGKIHKCSKAYNSQYLETYDGHYMAVYTVRWNHFHKQVFISCSADWTVKLWNHERQHPVMSFDLNNQVGDVAWAHWSATTFAACTTDGKVHVFDLSENKNEAMCEQKVVRKAKLTKLAFNPKDPILMVGDDHGCVSCLKLSPNLRWTTITKAEAERKAKEAEEAAAGGGRPQRGGPAKKTDSSVPQKSLAEQEIEKLDGILEMAVKNTQHEH